MGKWTVFLHPAQRRIIERDYAGAARVSGSAGTGKTIVALHRAVHLARAHPNARILLSTFSDALANALRTRLRRLIHDQPSIAERLEVHSIRAIGHRLYEANFETPVLASDDEIRESINRAADEVGEHRFSRHFLWTEWSKVVDACRSRAGMPIETLRGWGEKRGWPRRSVPSSGLSSPRYALCSMNGDG